MTPVLKTVNAKNLHARAHEALRLLSPRISAIIDDLHHAGATVYLVGGAVRDLLLKKTITDADIELHRKSPEAVQEILARHGTVEQIGASFGVLLIHGVPVDWSFPRVDSAGRKPLVTIDYMLPIDRALARRDVTINALALDLKTGELHDPYGGVDDLVAGVLRSPENSRFAEDPLRFYRVLQLMARFEAEPEPELTRICQHMSVTGVAHERIEAEFRKLLLYSRSPSRAFRWLKKIGRLKELYPELAILADTPQEPEWHPEGDVFEHSMQALDAAAHGNYHDDFHKLVIAYSALCHDMGKAVTTEKIDNRIRSHGHEIAGVKIAEKFMRKISFNEKLIENILKLVRYHMSPALLINSGAKPAAYKRLAQWLSPVSISWLVDLAYADVRGRNPHSHEPLTSPVPILEQFVHAVQNARVYESPEKPILLGRDLLEYISPGPHMGKLLAHAYEIQIEENIQDKKILLERILKEH